MERADSWMPVDPNVPNVARIYDLFLGGKDHYHADRMAAEQVLKVLPESPGIARANRAFLGRAVRYVAGTLGIRQFLDIGAGLPTRDNVHQVAQRVDTASRVVYVDIDPVVLSHARALLARDPETLAIEGDVRAPAEILANPELRAHLDLSRPVAVLLVAVLHFVTDVSEPHRLVRELMGAMPPGSCLVLSHAEATKETLEAAADGYRGANESMVPRSADAVRGFFDGVSLVNPGVVRVRDWRRDEDVFAFDVDAPVLAGVGIKP
ncbi:SAM-dependent methyltransferase [Acrocarpospora catenulata]|uniref:SAM-dependent methyltransferase n=1 Tax=Acrocarpospora catenulata TaxID=2836182 RepID=UPI0027E1A7E7|nr:SAM-dependent methyltransferase [Acrocarpospora catenulata]